MAKKKPNLADCPPAAGSIYDPTVPGSDQGAAGIGSKGPTAGAGAPGTNPYVPPPICVGDYSLISAQNAAADAVYQQQVAAENLSVSAPPVNVFKLLGVHEQGRLLDLTGAGQALGSGTPGNAFNSLLGPWVSAEVGPAVTSTPTYLGYDFGIRLTSYGQQEVAPDANLTMNVTSFQITQGPVPTTRALQVRVDRSNGGYCVDPLKVVFSGTGNGTFSGFTHGPSPRPGLLMITATSPTVFTVMFTGAAGTQVLGLATVGVRFNSAIGSFTILAGTTPFAVNDMFSAPIELEWLRVDVVNLPNVGTPATIRIAQSSKSRYWRLVPLLFAGGGTDPWVVQSLQFYDYQQTRLDDIQDTL